MRIIDRYLLRQFIGTFAICYLSLTGLYIVFDAFTHLDEFLAYSDRGENVLALLTSYYAYQAILFFEVTSGLLTLVAAMFTLAWIQRHNELTALMSAGISRIRVVAPLIVAAVAISFLGIADRELVIPGIRRELARQPNDLLHENGQPLQARYDHQTDVLIQGKTVHEEQRRIERPDILLPERLSDHGQKLTAENAFFEPPTDTRPGGYRFENVELPGDLDTRPSLAADGRGVLLTPLDTPWLAPGECFLVSDVSIEQLANGQTFRSLSSTAELIAGLHNRSLDFGADVRVAIHSRIVQPLLDTTLLFLGLPLVVARGNRNVFLAIGMCIGLVSVFLLVVIGLQHLGSLYLLDPALAAWAPLMLFVPAAVWQAETMWR